MAATRVVGAVSVSASGQEAAGEGGAGRRRLGPDLNVGLVLVKQILRGIEPVGVIRAGPRIVYPCVEVARRRPPCAGHHGAGRVSINGGGPKGGDSTKRVGQIAGEEGGDRSE